MSSITVTTIGLTCKAFLSSGLCTVTVNGLPTLVEALNSSQRENGCGVVTGRSNSLPVDYHHGKLTISAKFLTIYRREDALTSRITYIPTGLQT